MGCEKEVHEPIIDLLLTDGVLTSLSQFITIIQQQTGINEGLAEEVLDTNIYELLPGGQTVQERISKFFTDYNNLKGPKPGEGGLPGFIDEDDDGTPDGWTSPEDETTYTDTHDVSDDGLTGNISRLDGDAPTGFDNQTLQWLRDDLNTFLYDIDYDPVTAETDSRSDYENQSGGYLKFRGLNQAIIIRSTEEDDVGLGTYTSTGFTITMWVRFLDKVSSGTLFNYGNPLRTTSPTGFMLETFIDDSDADNRYIRLVLRDDSDLLRDSHVGKSRWRGQFLSKRIDTTVDGLPTENNWTYKLMNATRVPVDFNEWFFIVANYNPSIDETGSHVDDIVLSYSPSGLTTNRYDPDFWRNNVIPLNIEPTEHQLEENPYSAESGYGLTACGVDIPLRNCLVGSYTHSSGYGAKCKVELISRSDLLRAKGFKT